MLVVLGVAATRRRSPTAARRPALAGPQMRLIAEPELSYPVVCPGVENRPRGIPGEHNYGSRGMNFVLIYALVLSWLVTPNHWNRSVSFIQSGDFPPRFNLMS